MLRVPLGAKCSCRGSRVSLVGLFYPRLFLLSSRFLTFSLFIFTKLTLEDFSERASPLRQIISDMLRFNYFIPLQCLSTWLWYKQRELDEYSLLKPTAAEYDNYLLYAINFYNLYNEYELKLASSTVKTSIYKTQYIKVSLLLKSARTPIRRDGH